MFARFLIRYEWGNPSIPAEELRYWRDNDYFGSVSLDGSPTITSDEFQENVPVILESGPGKLQDLIDSNDPRCTFVEYLEE